MESKGRWFWRRDWYSVCSSHQRVRHDCARCRTGHWHYRWLRRIDGVIYQRYPRFWVWWHNLGWNKRRFLRFDSY